MDQKHIYIYIYEKINVCITAGDVNKHAEDFPCQSLFCLVVFAKRVSGELSSKQNALP